MGMHGSRHVASAHLGHSQWVARLSGERSPEDAIRTTARIRGMSITPTDQLRAWLTTTLRARGLSHAQLALRSGLDRSTISRILAGGRSPTFDTAARLLQALNYDDMPPSLATVANSLGPAVGIERALRADPELDEAQIWEVLRHYRLVRGRTT